MAVSFLSLLRNLITRLIEYVLKSGMVNETGAGPAEQALPPPSNPVEGRHDVALRPLYQIRASAREQLVSAWYALISAQ